MLPIVSYGLQDCLDRVDRLGIFPVAAIRILELSRNEESSLDDLEAAVSMDAVLAGRILKVANAPLFGLRARVGTLRRALQVLGFNGTRNVAIGLALSGVSQERAPWGQYMWEHSEATAWACRVVARRGRGLDPDSLFVAGLLHDLGLQLLLAVERDTIVHLLEKFGHDDRLLVKAERIQFGFDHAALGAECLRRWQLPAKAAELVECHHQGGGADPRSLAVLQISDVVAEALLGGASVDTLLEMVNDHPAAPALHIARGGLLAAMETLVEHHADVQTA